MNETANRAINLCLLTTCMCCFGSTFIFITLSLQDFTALASGSGRLVVAAFISLIYLIATKNKLPSSLNIWKYVSFYGVFCLACPFLLIPFALKSLSTSETAIYLSSIPLFVLLLAWIFLKEKISLKKWFGFFIGMVGLIILSGPEGIIPTESSHSILPALILIIASILIAAGGIVIQIMPKTPPVQLAAATFLIAGLFVCPIFSLALPDQITSTSSILGLICVGTFSTFVGMLSRVILIRRAGAVFASINGYGAPVVASVLGVLFLNEDLSFRTGVSFFIIIIGVLIAQNFDQKIYRLLKNL